MCAVPCDKLRHLAETFVNAFHGALKKLQDQGEKRQIRREAKSICLQPLDLSLERLILKFSRSAFFESSAKIKGSLLKGFKE